MQDHYLVIGVEPKATPEEIESAFQSALETRRAKRQRTSDVHVAHAVLSDAALRRAYDAARIGVALAEKVNDVKATTIHAASQASDMIPDVDLKEVAAEARQVGLKVTVVAAGAIAKGAEVTAAMSRRIQSIAARGIERPDRDSVD